MLFTKLFIAHAVCPPKPLHTDHSGDSVWKKGKLHLYAAFNFCVPRYESVGYNVLDFLRDLSNLKKTTKFCCMVVTSHRV